MEAISSIFFVICATALVVDVTSHPNPHIQGRIGAGNDAPLNHFTYQVSIRQAKEHVCSGAIISKRWVLTVCSCVKDSKTKDLKVYYGSRFLKSDAYITKVFQIFKHPEFNEKNLDNNVAMLSTSSDMEFVENMVGPINLPREQEPLGQQFLISGWRATDRKAKIKTFSDRLQYKHTQLIPLESCTQTAAPFVHSTSLCTSTDGGHGTCLGDLGSPMIAKNKERTLIGIASWFSEKDIGTPDVYTAVYPFLPWINKILEPSNRKK